MRFLLAEVLDAVGLPPGVFNLVSGTGAVVGEAIAAHPGVDMVSFTGSTRAGTRVAALAAPTVKKVSLELGGKSANVLLEDADLERAVTAGVDQVMLNSGQNCAALTRMIVPRSRLDEVEEIAARAASRHVAGNPFDERSTLGPLVSEAQYGRVRGLIRPVSTSRRTCSPAGSTASRGAATSSARPSSRASRPGCGSRARRSSGRSSRSLPRWRRRGGRARERLGVRAVRRRLVRRRCRAMRVARRLRTGQVEINGGAFNLAAPFGGYKRSGLGREAGEWGLDEVLEVKAIHR